MKGGRGEGVPASWRGTFHEIRGRLKVLTPEEVAELHKRKEELRSLEGSLGML